MSVNIDSLHKILNHPIRRKIVMALLEKQELTYIDLMNIVDVTNTGKLNYHLKILSDLIEKSSDGKYRLTEKGHLASQILQKFPEKITGPSPLKGGDAILVGFVGFLLTLANPGFWGFPLILYIDIGIAYLGLFYGFLVPSCVMWWLTTKRTNSHDLYDLFKPPFVSFILLTILFAFMLILHMEISITVQFSNSGGFSIVQPTLPAYLATGLFFPFTGVLIFEVIHRKMRKCP